MGAMTDLDYRGMLQALLPQGAAWPRDDDAVLTKLLHAEADELARVDQRMWDLLREADPRLTSEMLVDWERNYGLPDACMPVGATPDERRARLVQKVVWRGGLSIPYFQGLLESLGYGAATIDTFVPFRANSPCDQALNQNGWRYAWRVNVPGDLTIKPMTCSSPCDSAIRRWGDSTLNCILAMYKPAGTILFVAYGDFE